jgi:Arc/MetJ-type ribon-helix-helix transcriptional regulator
MYYVSGTCRHVPRKENHRMKVSGTVDDDLYKWMKKKIDDGKFYNPSHAIQRGLVKLREEEEKSS